MRFVLSGDGCSPTYTVELSDMSLQDCNIYKSVVLSKILLLCSLNFYRPQRSCGQGYVFTRVCDSVHRGGGSPGRENPPQLEDHPPGTRHTPTPNPPGPGRTPPGPGTPQPPGTRQNPPGTRQTPLAGRPPPGTRQTPPGSRIQNTVYERPVHILLECILVFFATLIHYSIPNK